MKKRFLALLMTVQLLPMAVLAADTTEAVADEAIVTTGTSATTFSPTDNCTRGQIVTFLYRTPAEK